MAEEEIESAEVEEVEESTEVEETEEVEQELDEEGNPVEQEIPSWMVEDDSESDSMPVSSHLKAKAKLKGKISERDEKIEALERKIAEIEQGKTAKPVATAKRPKEDDFDDDDEYETALAEWFDARIEAKQSSSKEKEQSNHHAQTIEKAVDDHYARAEKLIAEHRINPETYKASDTAVRKAVDVIFPSLGDSYVDQFIANLGEGSEKVIHYLGINKAAMNEFRAILQDDPTGLKAAVFLGDKRREVSGTKNKLSQARKPAAKISGDEQPTASAGKLKKEYDKALKANNGQAQYNAKKAARKAGIDVSKW